jgi:pimeloyl-ACP methyl ester carboxylesterase
MPEADAIRAVEDLAQSTGFEDTFNNTCSPFSAVEIRVPLTVAFGDCDWILTKEARLRNTLPAHTRWIEMPALGHVPMWVDPIGISRLILEGTQ